MCKVGVMCLWTNIPRVMTQLNAEPIFKIFDEMTLLLPVCRDVIRQEGIVPLMIFTISGYISII